MYPMILVYPRAHFRINPNQTMIDIANELNVTKLTKKLLSKASLRSDHTQISNFLISYHCIGF
jgi:hypothetical protein